MASGPHTFVIVGVFTSQPFQGNRLAIVAVRGNALTPQVKSLVAKEFGYTGTVFIHDAPGRGIPRRVEIFSQTGEELAFSGHCIIGTAHYIFQRCESSTNIDPEKPLTTVVMTKAGPIPLLYNMQRQVAACSVPHSYHLHSGQVAFSKVLNVQPQLQIVPTIKQNDDKTFPVVSIVKGMTFALIDLTETPEVLAALAAGKTPEFDLDEDWKPSFVGALYYIQSDALVSAGEPTIHSIQARVISHGAEDPGTGSACSALACHLAMQESSQSKSNLSPSENAVDELAKRAAEASLDSKAPTLERYVYAIQQGVEMGRPCTIAVEVDLSLESDGTTKVQKVTLSGRANFFAQGELARA